MLCLPGRGAPVASAVLFLPALATLFLGCGTPHGAGDADGGFADAGLPDEGLVDAGGVLDAPAECPPPSSPCVVAVREDGVCVERAVTDGEACDDGDACTTGDACSLGACVGEAVVCAPEAFPCLVDPACDPETGACAGELRPDGWGCDDGESCTRLDVCTAGTCVGMRPLPDEAPCEDGDLCTIEDRCLSGRCEGTPNPCEDAVFDGCVVQVCVPETGDCVLEEAPDGTPCSDKNTCTMNDTCFLGGCTGSPLDPTAGACDGPICFREGTVAAGFEGPDMDSFGDVAGGAAVFDADEDGDLDVMFTVDRWGFGGMGPRGRLFYFENDGSGGFTEASVAAGVADIVPDVMAPQGLLVADLDGDRHDDVYLYGRGENVVLKGAGDGTFTDVTTASGLGGGPWWTTAASVADFDGDGDLDLYEGNYFVSLGPSREPRPNRFYRNEGDGTFTDVSADFPQLTAGADTTLSVVFSDYDDDGDPDLFVCNDFGTEWDPNKLLRNEGDGTFTDVSTATNMRDGFFCMSVAPGDYDRDGDLDYYLSNIGVNRLMRWDGTAFTDDGDRAGIAGGFDECFLGSEDTSWAGRFVDLDHDGWLDLYLNNGDVDYATSADDDQNQVWQHQGASLTFASVGVDARAAYFDRDRGAAFGDLDGDGDIDVVSVRSLGFPLLLWNESAKRGSYLRVDLRGRDVDPVGARVVVETVEGERFIGEYRRNDGYGSSSEPVLHFGLGTTAGVASVEVRWPGGERSRVTTVRTDATLRIDEPAPAP
ncbi:MAG: CRTAC1 family protein [Myxococcota bacterium]